jgi:hypothetical protein
MSVTKASYYYLHPYVMICNTRPACSIHPYDPACHRRDRRFVIALMMWLAAAKKSCTEKARSDTHRAVRGIP